MRTYTVDDVMAHQPCCDAKARLPEWFGDRESMTLLDGLRMENIPIVYRLWAATRPGVLTTRQTRVWLDIIVERAIRRSLGRSGCPAWEIWAEGWLSGADQGKQSAETAAEAVWAAARWWAATADAVAEVARWSATAVVVVSAAAADAAAVATATATAAQWASTAAVDAVAGAEAVAREMAEATAGPAAEAVAREMAEASMARWASMAAADAAAAAEAVAREMAEATAAAARATERQQQVADLITVLEEEY